MDLPFVEAGRDGLVVHEAVRDALAGFLRSTNPTRYRQYRRAVWRELRDEMGDAAPAELWRYTADMLYLLDNPAVREAFFPSDAQPLAVEPVGRRDHAAVAAIVRRHEGPESAALLERWMAAAPASCSVMRDRDSAVVGFSMLLAGGMIRPPLVAGDPVVESWARHLRDHPLGSGEVALGLRRWLDAERGEAPGATQAASWLDAKRTYMELRPALRRMYVVVQDVPTYWPVVERLGFRPLDETGAVLDGINYTSVVLDFGPGSVDGWLAGLIAAELGVGNEPTIDAGARELVVRGEPVRLTPLEFGVFALLREREGRTVVALRPPSRRVGNGLHRRQQRRRRRRQVAAGQARRRRHCRGDRARQRLPAPAGLASTADLSEVSSSPHRFLISSGAPGRTIRGAIEGGRRCMYPCSSTSSRTSTKPIGQDSAPTWHRHSPECPAC